MAKKKPNTSKKIIVQDKSISITSNTSDQKNFWSTNVFPLILLFLLPFVLYFASISYEYVLDDKIVLSENNYVKKGFSGIVDIFKTDSFQGYFGEQKKLLEGGRYRPLSLVTFAIEHQFFGLNPKVSHFVNILLFALSGLLFFRVFTHLLPQPKDRKWFLSLPFLISLLFVLHPIHVEVVANIKGRDEILALMLSFGALYYAIRFIQSNKLVYLIPTCLILLLAILAKENALTWLVIIPMSLYFFTKSSWSNLGKISFGLSATVAVYFAIRYNALGYFLSSGQESTSIMNNPYYGLDIGQKAATIVYTLGMYLKLLVFPHPLTHDYYPYQIPIVTFTDWRALLSLVINLGLGIYALLGLRKKSLISYAILFYFITLSIVSNIFVNVGTTMNDRFVYMPSIGLCITIAYLIARWIPKKINVKKAGVNLLSVGILAILIIGYATKTMTRVPDWENALTLNTAAVKYSPNSARANCFMGVALFENYKVETDRERKAQYLNNVTYYINRALELYPSYGSALTMKAGIAAENFKVDHDIDKLLASFTMVLQFKTRTDFIDEYVQYLMNQGIHSEKLIQFLYNIGYALNFQNRRDYATAIHHLNFAYQIDPTNHNIIRAIANSYQNLGDQTKANEYFRKINE